LPSRLENLYFWTFGGCPSVKISTFGGANGESRLISIGENCFNGAGNGSEGPKVTEVIINNSILKIEENAFVDYAKNTLKDVYFARSDENTLEIYG
jgi:hypothetical protein